MSIINALLGAEMALCLSEQPFVSEPIEARCILVTREGQVAMIHPVERERDWERQLAGPGGFFRRLALLDIADAGAYARTHDAPAATLDVWTDDGATYDGLPLVCVKLV